MKISWERMNEIASRALDALYELDPEAAIELAEEDLDLDEEEKNWFCIEYWFDNEDDDDEEDDNNEDY